MGFVTVAFAMVGIHAWFVIGIGGTSMSAGRTCFMKAAWYERQGPADKVLRVGEMPDPTPGAGEVRIRIAGSGVNPGDVKKRQDEYAVGMPYPRIIPHSDGSGTIDQVGDGVAASRIGERVWCYGAQSYRPFGTAAEYAVLPAELAVPLPDGVSFEQGACLGIPGITARRAVHVGGSVDGRIVLVQGGGGSVGQCAVALAKRAGAFVIATVRSDQGEAAAHRAGAQCVVNTRAVGANEVKDLVMAHAPEGVDHIVEVAFDANVSVDEALLRQGGSIAAYATSDPAPVIPFWPLVFKNVRLFFLGSDDFPHAEKSLAARDLTNALAEGWTGFEVQRFPLEAIVEAHEALERGKGSGRIVLDLGEAQRSD